MDESEQLRAEIRRVFDAFDTDGNGVINPSEVKGLMVTLLKREPTPEEVQNAVQMMDKNKDGVIELDEFTETMTKWVTDGAEGSNEGPGSPPPFLKKRSKSGRGLDATGHGDGDGGGRKRVHSEIAQFFRQFQARPDVAALQARLLARPPKGEPSPDAWRLGFAPLAPAEKAALLAHAAGLKARGREVLEALCSSDPAACLQAAQALSQALSLCVKFDSPAERLDIAYELIELFEMVTEAIPGAAPGGPPRSAAGRLCELLDATSPVELQEAACEALYYFVLGPQVPHLPPGNPWHRDQALPKHLVVQHQLLPRLKTVIQAGGHGRPALVGGAARCVGAFAERTPEARGAALASGFLPLLLELVRPDMPTELERPVTYAVAVLLGYTHGGLGGVGGRAAPSEAELRLVLEKLWPLLRRHDAPAGAGAEGAAAAALGAAAAAGAAPPDEAVTANVVLAVRCVLPACHEIPLELTRRLVELTGATWPTLVGGKFAVRALLDCLHDLCVTHPEAAAEAARGGTPLLERLEALLDVDEDALGDLVAAALRLLEALLHEGGLHDAVLLDERRRFVPRLVHLLSSRAVAAELGAARCLFALTLGGAAHLRALAARGAGRALFQVFGRLKQHDDVLADAYGYLGPSFNLELVWLAKRCLANLMAAGEKMRDGDGDGGPHPFAEVFGEEGVDRVAQLHAEVCREVRRGRLSATRDLADLAAGLRDLLEGIAGLRRGEEDPRAGEVRAACAEALKDWHSKLAEAVRAQDARETMEVDAAGALPWGEEGGAPSPFAAAGGPTVRLKVLPLWGDEFQRDVRILPVPAAARLAELRNYLTACYGTPVELQHAAAPPAAGTDGGGGGPAGEKITITSQETLSGLLAAAAAAGDLLPIYLLAKTARAGTAAVAAVRLGPREYELRKLRAQGVALSGALLNQIYDYFKQLNVPALDFARFKEGMAPLGLTEAQASEAFAAFDVNKDGGVTLSELACGLSILVDGTLEDRLQYAFMAFDADGNGTLSPDELTQLVAASTGYEAAVARAVAQEVFKQFDANRDGSIDFQEFTQAVLANRVMLSTFWTNGLPGLSGLGAGAAGGGGGDHPSASRAPTTQQQRRTRSQQWTSYLARGAQQQQQQQQQTVGIVKPLSRTRGSNNLAYYQQRQQQQSRSNTNWRAPGGGRDMVNSPVPPPPPRRQGGLEGFSFQKDNRSNAFQRDYDI